MSTPRRPAPRSIGTPITPILRRFFAMKASYHPVPGAHQSRRGAHVALPPGRVAPRRARTVDAQRARCYRRPGMDSNRIRSLTAAAGLLLTVCAATDGTRFARPSPSPAPIKPDHRVLFADDFSETALAGWRPDRRDVWSVWHGMLRADLPDEKQLRSLIYAGDS